jgi:hypothetical protein
VQIGVGVRQEFEQNGVGNVYALGVELGDGGIVLLCALAGAQIGKPFFLPLGAGEKGATTFGKKLVKLILTVAQIHGYWPKTGTAFAYSIGSTDVVLVNLNQAG